MEIKKNIPLIIGVSIPFLMILFVAGSIYLPGLFIKPANDFLYMTGGDYYGPIYSIFKGRIVKNDIERPESYVPKDKTKLYMHDITENKSREISLEEARRFVLDSNPLSPDGFEIIHGSKNEGIFPFIFFSGKDYSTLYIKGHSISKKLNIQTGGNYYSYRDFRFLGWIIE